MDLRLSSGHVFWNGRSVSSSFGPMRERVPESQERSTDEQLMCLSAAGDLNAFGELVDRHHQRALNFAYRLCGDREISKDIVQESFLRILKAARRYEPRARFTSYLYSVVRNMVRETARRTHRRREEPLEDRQEISAEASLPAGPSAPSDPERERQKRLLQKTLLDAVRSLPEDLRMVFVLSEMEGLSYREIAGICRCPLGTIASRKHVAIEKLRVLLKPIRSQS
jgi:RNA polymerase sigma-70 factor (ECF subfamily)